LTSLSVLDIFSSMKKDDKPMLGTYLKSLRDAKGLSLRDVEELSGISNAFVSQLESGKVKHPSPIKLFKLAEIYGAPYEALMERAGYPVPENNLSAGRFASAVFNRLGKITEGEEQSLLDYLSFLRSTARRGDRKK
jgi:HTH-type transcriptional regulator, competence development regulator